MILEKLWFLHILKKRSAFYATRSFTSVFTRTATVRILSHIRISNLATPILLIQDMF